MSTPRVFAGEESESDDEDQVVAAPTVSSPAKPNEPLDGAAQANPPSPARSIGSAHDDAAAGSVDDGAGSSRGGDDSSESGSIAEELSPDAPQESAFLVAQKRLLRQRNVSLRHTVMLNVSNVIETTQLCLTHNSSKLTSTRSVAQEAHHSCHDASTNLSELLKRFKSVSVDEVRKGQRQAVSE